MTVFIVGGLFVLAFILLMLIVINQDEIKNDFITYVVLALLILILSFVGVVEYTNRPTSEDVYNDKAEIIYHVHNNDTVAFDIRWKKGIDR